MRILGLDYGTKRIGVAMSDPLGMTAQGIQVIERTRLQKDIAIIKEICEREAVESIVMGLPLNMDGSRSAKVEEVERFAALLTENLGLPIYYQDERLTTRAVEATLIQADVSRSKRRKVVDKLAAVYILQGYLDARERRLR